MHGMIMVVYFLTALFLGGFGNYMVPLMLGSPGHGIPVPQHDVRLDLPDLSDHFDGELFRRRWARLAQVGRSTRHRQRWPERRGTMPELS